MSQPAAAFLVVENGAPYHEGEVLPLTKGRLLLGRTWQELRPDFPFASPYVSRQHAIIELKEGYYALTDVGSRRGTIVNGNSLIDSKPYLLNDGDRIILAGGAVVLLFVTGIAPGDTVDPPSTLAVHSGALLKLDKDRQEAFLLDRKLAVPGKLYMLLQVLYSNRGRVVDEVTIRRAVWPERPKDDMGVPDVTDEEVGTLVHRLRKQLQEHQDLLVNKRGAGYLLDLPR